MHAKAANDSSEFETMSVARRRSEIVAAAVYLGAGLALLLYFLARCHWIRGSWTDNRYEIAALLGATILLISSVRVFMARRFGDLMALIGALLVWPYFRLAEFNRYFSSWVLFNVPGVSPDQRTELFFAALTVVAISALVAATAYSALRLTPRIWLIGKLSLRDRVWPGFVITFMFVVIWYLKTVTPYQIPIYDLHGVRPIVSILHVEKHGLQFRETNVAFYRDGEFYVAHDNHRLFQYSFQRSWAKGELTEDYFRLLHELANSPPEFIGSDVSSYVPPHSWNADRWFVFIEGRAGRKPVNVEASTMPDEVVSLFYEAQKLPLEWTEQDTMRDVCLGFCYDPTY